MTLIAATIVMFLLATAFTVALGIANQKLHVETDPRQAEIEAALPQVNCGGCGYASCAAYAEAVAKGEAEVNLCGPGGADVATKIAAIMGVELGESWTRRPVVHCCASQQDRKSRPRLLRISTCGEANVSGQPHACAYGCLGLGDCMRACAFGAIRMKDGLPVIDYALCTSCGACERACPRGIIEMVPFKAERMMIVACNSKDPGRVVRQICPVGCIACGACARASDLFKVEANLAAIDYEQYDPESDLQTAAEKCPTRVIAWVGPATSEPQKPPKPAKAKKQTASAAS